MSVSTPLQSAGSAGSLTNRPTERMNESANRDCVSVCPADLNGLADAPLIEQMLGRVTNWLTASEQLI